MEAVTPLLTLHCVEFQDSRWRVLGRPGLLSGLLPPSAGCLGEESSLTPLLQGGDRDQELSTSPVPALVSPREEGSTLCNVSGICVGNVVSYVDIEVGLYW